MRSGRPGNSLRSNSPDNKKDVLANKERGLGVAGFVHHLFQKKKGSNKTRNHLLSASSMIFTACRYDG
jgi:hypothetical protein